MAAYKSRAEADLHSGRPEMADVKYFTSTADVNTRDSRGRPRRCVVNDLRRSTFDRSDYTSCKMTVVRLVTEVHLWFLAIRKSVLATAQTSTTSFRG